MPHANGFFALTTRGLEGVSAREIDALPGVTVTSRAYRRITAISIGPLGPVLGQRTVDDVFLDVATWSEIAPRREALSHLRRFARRLVLHDAIATLARLRPIGQLPTYSVSVNFVGRRNYGVDEIKAVVAEGVGPGNRLTYCSDDRHADLNLRVFIEHDVAFVGVRLGKTPLHERTYRVVRRPGALKPPIAAALLALADATPGRRLLDPCCGTGTILIEATLAGVNALGGDSDPDALRACRTNATAAAVAMPLVALDARQLPMAKESVNIVVTNLPWGRQVGAGVDLISLYRQCMREIERVLVSDGVLAVLTSLPHLVLPSALRCRGRLEISLAGQRPTVLVFGA